MAVVPAQGRVFDVGERTLLENFASQLAFALEKDHVLAAMQHAELSERSAHLQKTLLDSVSHELKTPLTALQAAADALASQTPASAQSLLKEQQMALVRLKRVINNLLDMSRLEAGVIQPKLEWCNVPEIIHAALDQAGEVLKLHPVQLEIPEELPFVKIDQALVEQCVCNLLLNAAAHTPAGTEVRVSVKLSFGRLEISVRDRGPGLPVLASSTLFDKFTRGPHAVTGGSGLGLSIVRGFVQALRGSVRAANHPEGGALFTLDFPVETLETLPEENA
jgi:two-component system sensor histidine kinase KdpD